MTRITSTILVFMILINGGVTIMESSGLSDDLGVELAPGVSEAMDNVTERMKQGFQPNIGVVESLINLFLAGLGIFQVVIEAVFAAPSMFMNLGFPDYIVSALFAPAYLISTLEMVFIATGRDLV